jgi:hypothetical protein
VLPSRLRRLPYLIAVALVAAAFGDPFVESLANGGVFGRAYHDGNQLSVVPTLVLALALAFALGCRRAVAAWRRSRETRSDWVIAMAERGRTRSPLRDVPVVFVTQLAAVFAMEAIEQLITGQPLELGLSWLGGPVAVSLAIHALICIALTLALARLCVAIAATVDSLVRAALRFVLALAASALPVRFAARRFAVQPRAQAPHARQIGGRAPPRALTLP